MKKTIDFGAPSEFGMHHFYVEIPSSPKDAVQIYEDYGFNGDGNLRETVECRVILAREIWAEVRNEARKDFNVRLKEKRQSVGRWTTGKVKLDRFLGRELCVLAWAAEHASPEECMVIVQKWSPLRPEERWWLYSKTASEAGHYDQKQHGWRKALYCALSDASNVKLRQKNKPKTKKQKVEQQDILPFYDFVEKEMSDGIEPV